MKKKKYKNYFYLTIILLILLIGYGIYVIQNNNKNVIIDSSKDIVFTIYKSTSYKQEVPKAFIVLKKGYLGFFVKEDIKKYCKKHLAKYMVPQEYVFRKQLPKTKLGKVDFKTLQEDKGVDDDE